jgi:hypothetical protein
MVLTQIITYGHSHYANDFVEKAILPLITHLCQYVNYVAGPFLHLAPPKG